MNAEILHSPLFVKKTPMFVSVGLAFGFLLFLFLTRATSANLRTFGGNVPRIENKYHGLTYDFDLDKEKFFVHVPGNYDGTEPFGIVAFVFPGDRAGLPGRDWKAALAAKKLIYIAAANVGNQRPVPRRAGLTIVGVYKLMEQLNIDESRIYVSGHSGGARVACMLGYFHSDLFSGVLPFCGANFHEHVARVHATKDDKYGYFRVEPEVAAAAKRRVRFALITSENDWRKGNVMDLLHGGFDKHHFEAKLFVAPRKGHEYRGARFFLKGLEFIEQGRRRARVDTRRQSDDLQGHAARHRLPA